MMKKITLKNSDLLQTVEITFDGFNFQQKIIQHGFCLVVKSVMEDEIGGADEAVDCISEYMQNGFNVYVNDGAVNSIRSIVHAIDELGGDYEDE